MKRTYISEITPNTKKVFLEGWVADIRDLGGLKFILLRDRSGIIQVTATKKKTDPKLFEKISEISKETVVLVEGEVTSNKKAPSGLEIIPSSVEIINKATSPLPIDVSQKSQTGIDKRLDWRFLDTRRPEIAAIFKIRSKIFKSCADFFDKSGFININTPKMTKIGLESGAELFPIVYFGKEAFLAQSPQFYKQMFVMGGFEKVYEIGPVFRAEKSHTTRHLTEFTGIDFEMGFIKDENEIMDVVEEMMKYVLSEVKKICKNELELLKVEVDVPKKIPRISMKEAKDMLAKQSKKIPEDEDFDAEAEELLGKLIKKKYNCEFVFVYHYPWKKRPYYHMKSEDNPNVTKSFDLIWKGVEVATGSQREHRYEILKKQAEEKATKLDPTYGDIFRYGAVPHGGVGFGLDRLTQRLLNLDNVREALLLPRDPERLTP